MKDTRKKDPSARYCGAKEMPDPYDVCAICGENIYWPDEEIGWDDHNQICHAACVEKEGRSGN